MAENNLQILIDNAIENTEKENTCKCDEGFGGKGTVIRCTQI